MGPHGTEGLPKRVLSWTLYKMHGVTRYEIHHEPLPPEFPANSIGGNGIPYSFIEKPEHEQIHGEHTLKTEKGQQGESHTKGRCALE